MVPDVRLHQSWGILQLMECYGRREFRNFEEHPHPRAPEHEVEAQPFVVPERTKRICLQLHNTSIILCMCIMILDKKCSKRINDQEGSKRDLWIVLIVCKAVLRGA